MRTDTGKDRNPPKEKVKKERFNGVQFINFNLSIEQRGACKSWALSLEDLDNFALQLAESDYKITLGYDNYSEAFACFVTPKGDKHVHAGWILSGRGSTPLKAFKQACFIHYHLFQEDWSEHQHVTQGVEIDD